MQEMSASSGETGRRRAVRRLLRSPFLWLGLIAVVVEVLHLCLPGF